MNTVSNWKFSVLSTTENNGVCLGRIITDLPGSDEPFLAARASKGWKSNLSLSVYF